MNKGNRRVEIEKKKPLVRQKKRQGDGKRRRSIEMLRGMEFDILNR